MVLKRNQLVADYEFKYFSKNSSCCINEFKNLILKRGRYEGETVNISTSASPIIEGRGKLIMHNGDTYIGDFWRNAIHGSGMLILKTGDFYEGRFVNNQMNGQGTYYFQNGDFY